MELGQKVAEPSAGDALDIGFETFPNFLALSIGSAIVDAALSITKEELRLGLFPFGNFGLFPRYFVAFLRIPWVKSQM